MTPEEIKKMQADYIALSKRVDQLENKLSSARVVIKNLEGAFKIATSAVTTNDMQEGSLILSNESGTYKLYARINNGWRSVTLT